MCIRDRWILSQLVTGAQSRLREEGIRGEVYLFKNNTDSAGNSYGCHENYLTERNDDFNRYTEVLIPFLVSRQIYAGAGKVLQTARGAVFCVSQRAEHIWEGVSSATTRSRPIINTRDEPHADAERFRRLHVIVGDSNMSEYATFLKVDVYKRQEILFYRDFASGAMIENIVRRAKKLAIKREIAAEGSGIRTDDLLESIRQEYKENEDLPNTTNPDDWARISGKKGERIVYVRTLMADNDNEVGGRAIERVGTGQYL